MKIFISLIVIVAILFTGCGNFEMPEEAPVITEPSITTTTAITHALTTTSSTTTAPPPEIIPQEESQIIYEPITLPPHLKNLNWLVEPMFDYERFSYCSMCDVFLRNEGIVDERTALMTEHRHGAHSGLRRNRWVYDPDLDLFGVNIYRGGTPDIELYPMDEFIKHFPDDSDRINVVRRVDSTIREISHYDGGYYFPREAFSGAAVAIGNELITDFIYDNDLMLWETFWFREGRDVINAVEVSDESGYRGIIGRNAEVIIPFEFEEILIIDEWSAFVKYDKHWGIVGFSDYIPDFRPSGDNNAFLDGDFITEKWQVIQDPNTQMFSIVNNNGNKYNNLDFDILLGIGGRKFNGERNNGTDIYNMNVKDNEIILISVRLQREWADSISIRSEFFHGDISEAISSAEKLAEKAKEYIYGLGHEMLHSISVSKGYPVIIHEDIYSVYLYAWRNSHIFEAKIENGEWTIFDVTPDYWIRDS
jgi:hypothetical protein